MTSNRFTIMTHRDARLDAPEWASAPGFAEGRGFYVVTYFIGRVLWVVGVCFSRKQDAEFCREWLWKHGYTPQTYHEERDDVLEKVKREIISNLAW